MNKAGSAAKVKLNSFDDLFGASDMTAGTDQVQEIPLSELYEFRGHPFKVLDDEKMQETVESIKNYGVLMPGIARPRAEGGYEIIAGHRRKHGCELAGLSTMPMFLNDPPKMVHRSTLPYYPFLHSVVKVQSYHNAHYVKGKRQPICRT